MFIFWNISNWFFGLDLKVAYLPNKYCFFLSHVLVNQIIDYFGNIFVKDGLVAMLMWWKLRYQLLYVKNAYVLLNPVLIYSFQLIFHFIAFMPNDDPFICFIVLVCLNDEFLSFFRLRNKLKLLADQYALSEQHFGQKVRSTR